MVINKPTLLIAASSLFIFTIAIATNNHQNKYSIDNKQHYYQSIVKIAVETNGRVINFEIKEAVALREPIYFQVKKIDNRKIAYIKLDQFNEYAVQDLGQAIKEAESQQVKGYVLDLRWNSGGRVPSAINIARMWLKEVTIVMTVNRQGIYIHQSATHEALTDKPLAVIVNSNAASVSEIVASTLQQNNRAIIVGDKTLGKVSIQPIEPLSGGSSLMVTIDKVLTPNKNEILDRGIQPDLKVKSAKSALNKLKRNPNLLATKKDLMWVKAVEVLER